VQQLRMGKSLVVLTAAWPSRRYPATGSFIRSLTQAIENRGFQTLVVAPATGAPRKGSNRVIHFPQPLGRPKLRGVDPLGGLLYLVSCTRRVLAALRAAEPVLLLAHWVLPVGPAALLASRKEGVPLAVWAHGSDLAVYARRSRAFGALAAWVLQGADLVLAVSKDLAACASSLGAANVKILPMGVAPCFCRPVEGEPAEPFTALFLGDFIPAKGIRTILTAKRLLGVTRKIRFIFVGSGPLRREIEEAGCELILNAPAPLVAGLLDRSHVLLLPSRSEGTPLSVLEALRRGVPVIATSVGGIPEWVSHGREGLLLGPVPSALELARALARLYDDRGFWRRLRRACIARAPEVPSSNRIAERFCAEISRAEIWRYERRKRTL